MTDRQEKCLQVQEQKAVTQSTSEQLVGSENAYRPTVDILHSPDDFIFLVDLPGVSQGDVKLEINERNTLILSARNGFEQSGNPVFRQTRLGHYYRAFELGDNIDREKVVARMDHGVLEIRIGKKEQARPRKIEIQI
ncbi:MAG: molecular chaperone Hsp20 [Candidatus Melainabacteria bacterium HGW-Melainabacteria-1]|nr:MAG: molecular chaperone Hsp20 [Candidatus Melainabacteria bacterium HGW-Melainabacteria-1]